MGLEKPESEEILIMIKTVVHKVPIDLGKIWIGESRILGQKSQSILKSSLRIGLEKGKIIS